MKSCLSSNFESNSLVHESNRSYDDHCSFEIVRAHYASLSSDLVSVPCRSTPCRSLHYASLPYRSLSYPSLPYLSSPGCSLTSSYLPPRPTILLHIMVTLSLVRHRSRSVLVQQRHDLEQMMTSSDLEAIFLSDE